MGIKQNCNNKTTARVDYLLAALVVCLYFLYNYWLKNNLPQTLRPFFLYYFNDLMCPIVFMAYVNRLLAFIGKSAYKLYVILIICFVCGCFWEYAAPLFRRGSVSDIYDLCCYCAGGAIYWAVHKTVRFFSNKRQNKV